MDDDNVFVPLERHGEPCKDHGGREFDQDMPCGKYIDVSEFFVQ